MEDKHPMANVKVIVTLKPSLLDAQGRVVKDGLISMGYENVQKVRIGKYLELEIDADQNSNMDAQVKEMCDRLLANTVIENYSFEVTE